MTALPLPFSEIPPRTERLTTVRFLSVMRPLLEGCHGLATMVYVASTHPDGLPDGLSEALFILEQYLDATRHFFLRFADTQHPGPRVQEEGEPSAVETPQGGVQ